MNFQKPYDWEAISDFAMESGLTSARQLARETHIPRSSIRGALSRGELRMYKEVGETPPEKVSVSIIAMTKDEAWEKLPQFGYDPQDWTVDSVMVGEFRDHISHKFRLTPRVIDAPRLRITPTQYNVEATNRSKLTEPAGDVHICIPDIHFGYIDDKPIHREEAIEPLLQFIWMSRPKTVVLLGDLLDLTEWTRKFAILPSHIQKTQKAIDSLSHFLAMLRDAAPKAKIAALEGNHDARFSNLLSSLLPQAYSLRTVGGTTLFDLSTYIPFDKYNIEWVPGYPNNEYRINYDTVAVHGNRASSIPGKSADNEFLPDSNIVFGHIHRMECIWKVGADDKRYFAMSPGTMTQLDETVPGNKKRNSWHNGVAVLVEKGGMTIPYTAVFNGREFL